MISRDTNKPMVSQVAMIQSKFEKQQTFIAGRKVHLPAAIFNKSPSRLMPNALHSPNRATTPSRLHGKVTSPIRFRKQMPLNQLSNYFTQPNMLGSGHNRAKSKGQPYLLSSGVNCTNTTHGLKTGTFSVETQEGQLPYCQKCAILLASQGFKVGKIQKSNFQNGNNSRLSTLYQLDNPERRSELITFLSEIQKINSSLMQRKIEIEGVLKSNHSYFGDQEQIVEQYFNQIKGVIQSQRVQLVEQIRSLQREADRVPDFQLKKIMSAISDCEVMKDDISESIQIINQVNDESFNRVIVAYKSKANEIRSTDRHVCLTSELPRIMGDDVQEVGRRIVGLLNFRIQTEEKNNGLNELNPFENRQSSVYFSFDNQSKQEPMVTSTSPTITSGHSQQNQRQGNIKNSLSRQMNSNLNYEYDQIQ